VTDRETDGRTDGQNYGSQDRASIAASRGKNAEQYLVNLALQTAVLYGDGRREGESSEPNELERFPIDPPLKDDEPQDTLCIAPCLKNVSPLTCYDLDIHDPITIVFGTSVTEKVKIRRCFVFPPHIT